MRNALLALLMVLGLGTAAPAQSTPWAQKVFLGVSSHDFGTCPHGAQLKHRFLMKNIYAVPLQITNIRTSCSCVSYQLGSPQLKPQEEGYLDIVMDARRFKGPKTVNLYITVGPEYVSTALLTLTANARPDVVFNPGEVNFGVVPASTTPAKTIDVEYAGSMDWRITEIVKSKSAPFTIVPRELYREPARLLQAGKVGYQLEITLKADAPAGPFRQELLLKTNDPTAPVLTAVVEGSIQAALEVQPKVVSLGTVRAGQETSQKILVRGNRPFRVVAVEGTGEGIEADLPTTLETLHVITLRCQPKQEGPLQHELRIRTDLGQGETATVTVKGTVSK